MKISNESYKPRNKDMEDQVAEYGEMSKWKNA